MNQEAKQPLILDIQLEKLDEQRIHCIVELSKFNQNPDLVIELSQQNGEPLASITIIETPDHHNSYVLHTKKPMPIEQIIVQASLLYSEQGIVHQITKSFSEK